MNLKPIAIMLEFVRPAQPCGRQLGKKLGLEDIVSKKLDAPYKSGPSKTWLKIKNPKASAATSAIDGTF
jgi:hypothetical protein